MTIERFIEMKNYSKNVKKGGFPYLLEKWKRISDCIPYTKKFLLDEYLNNIMTRQVIEAILINCEITSEDKCEVNRIDTIFREKTVELPISVWSGNIRKDSHNWYEFRVPLERIPDWYPPDSDEMKTYYKLTENNV